MREMYREIDPAPHVLSKCPVCSASAKMWEFSENPTDIVTRVAACSDGEEWFEGQGMVNEGCLLYMPPNCFYKPTARQAAAYWNKHAEILTGKRAKNERAV
jgi:hypothetical protein